MAIPLKKALNTEKPQTQNKLDRGSEFIPLPKKKKTLSIEKSVKKRGKR